MWKRMKQLARLSMDELYMELAIIGGAFAFGVILVAIILKCIEGETSYVCIGSLMSAGGLVMGFGVLGGLQFYMRFQLALSMQRSRMRQILAELALMLVRAAVLIAVVIALVYFEPKLMDWLFPGMTNELDLTEFVTVKYFMIALIVLTLLSLLMSAVYNRYGTKGWLIIYFSIMGLCFLLPRLIVLITDHEENPIAAAIIAAVTVLVELPAMAHTVINVLLALGVVGISVRMLMHSAVHM